MGLRVPPKKWPQKLIFRPKPPTFPSVSLGMFEHRLQLPPIIMGAPNVGGGGGQRERERAREERDVSLEIVAK